MSKAQLVITAGVEALFGQCLAHGHDAVFQSRQPFLVSPMTISG